VPARSEILAKTVQTAKPATQAETDRSKCESLGAQGQQQSNGSRRKQGNGNPPTPKAKGRASLNPRAEQQTL